MKVLVIGGGGREHTIVWKLAQSPKVTKIYCAPGNGGISALAQCVPIGATALTELADFAEKEQIDLTVVGPDDPLAMGAVDVFEARGLRVFGPNREAAQLEASKVFSKNLMKKYHLPTAAYEVFSDSASALAYLQNAKFPIVVKADGLALGKGVIIAKDLAEAEDAVRGMMEEGQFGTAGSRVVIEEFMTGPEVSVLAFCDGKHVVPMVSAQDHKRAYDHDEGPNTGGMGTFSPSRVYTPEIAAVCEKEIFKPTVEALLSEGITFKGVLYFGLMLTEDGPKILEYNARFGDPETQVVLPRLKTDLVDIFEAAIDGTLDKLKVEWDDGAAVCVVMASGGYPKKYQTGYPISGIPEAEEEDGITVFHAGTKAENGQVLTSGGRVLGVTAVGKDLDEAIKKSYAAVEKIHFENVHYRRDIGIK